MSTPRPNARPITDEPAAIDPIPVDLQPRNAKGHFAKGHRVNETHGTITLERRGPSPEQAAEMRAWRSQVVAELGGETEISTIKLRMLDHLTFVGTMIVFLGGYLAAAGPLTPRGRQRSSVSTLLSCCATYERIAKTIGLEKQSKRVQSVMDVINAPDEVDA